MSGQGTIISGREGQTGTASVNKLADGQPENQLNTIQSIEIPTGTSVSQRDPVSFTYDSKNNPAMTSGAKGTRAKGNVDRDGRNIRISDAGSTVFAVNSSYEIDLSGNYGSNSGYNSTNDVYCSDVKGKAAYLSRSN